MTTYAADPIVALMEIVKRCDGFSALTGGRVFGAELPEAEQSSMPRACVVVSAVGLGSAPPGAADYRNILWTRLDVRAYGANMQTAGTLSATLDRGIYAWDRETVAGIVVWGAKRVAGPVQYRAAPGDWPVVVRTYDVLHSVSTV